MKRSTVLLGSMAALIHPAVSVAAADKVVVSWGTVEATNIPVWIANDGGHFRDAGLDVDLRYVASALQVPALISGDIQIAQIGGPEVVSANVAGGDLVIVATLGPVYTYRMVLQKDIASLADLKGRPIGVSRFGNSEHVAMRIALRRVGIDPKEINFVQVGSASNRNAAMIAGSIAGGVVSPGADIELEAQGMHVVLDIGAMKIPAANITIAMQRSWLATHRPTVQRYVDAIVNAIHREKTDRAFSLATIKAYTKSENTRAMEETWSVFSRMTPSIPYPRVEQFREILVELAKGNDKIKGYDVAQCFDDSLLKDAVKRLKLS